MPPIAEERVNGIGVRVRPFENIDDALRRFKKSVQKSGILVDARRIECFVSRPERRRVKSAKARKRRGPTDGNVDLGSALNGVSQRSLAQRGLLDFAKVVNQRFEAPVHVRYLAGLLERVESGDIRRLAISAPPGHGKSTLLNSFVPYFLARAPRRRIITISASESLAKRNSRDAQALVRLSDGWPWPDIGLSNESVLEWGTTNGGECRAIGKGGVVTGFRAEGIVVDDLQSDAGSEVTRASGFEWFRSVLTTRLEPNGWVVVINTRWNDGDIIGQLRDSEGADQWMFVNLPAIALENDVLGRVEGANCGLSGGRLKSSKRNVPRSGAACSRVFTWAIAFPPAVQPSRQAGLSLALIRSRGSFAMQRPGIGAVRPTRRGSADHGATDRDTELR